MVDIKDGFVTLRERPLILKMRSLGAGVEEGDEARVSLLEAAYFAERGVLPLSRDELLARAAESDPLAREKYAVIKHLRNRGYIVRPSLDGTPFLRLHRKGYRPGEDKTYYLIEAVNKDWSASPESLMSSLEAAGRMRKELAIAIVDPAHESPLFIKLGRINFE